MTRELAVLTALPIAMVIVIALTLHAVRRRDRGAGLLRHGPP
ncbi:MAG TPA: hypothetical protein VNS46_16445 [Nocardioides sp.]|nr:hypothetical protein [Nocardioides sp.]